MSKGFEYFSENFEVAANLGIDYGFDYEINHNEMKKKITLSNIIFGFNHKTYQIQ